MGRKGDRNAGPEERLDGLLYDLCDEWGFCNWLSASELLSPNGAIDADEFVSAVLIAEGMNPEYEKKWVKRIRGKFTDKFGLRVSLDPT